MTLLDLRRPSPPALDASQQAASRAADATTILAIFVVLQFVLPSKLVINGLPLSLSAASLVALALGVLWASTQLPPRSALPRVTARCARCSSPTP